jgi:hypothetical protein
VLYAVRVNKTEDKPTELCDDVVYKDETTGAEFVKVHDTYTCLHSDMMLDANVVDETVARVTPDYSEHMIDQMLLGRMKNASIPVHLVSLYKACVRSMVSLGEARTVMDLDAMRVGLNYEDCVGGTVPKHVNNKIDPFPPEAGTTGPASDDTSSSCSCKRDPKCVGVNSGEGVKTSPTAEDGKRKDKVTDKRVRAKAKTLPRRSDKDGVQSVGSTVPSECASQIDPSKEPTHAKRNRRPKGKGVHKA